MAHCHTVPSNCLILYWLTHHLRCRVILIFWGTISSWTLISPFCKITITIYQWQVVKIKPNQLTGIEIHCSLSFQPGWLVNWNMPRARICSIINGWYNVLQSSPSELISSLISSLYAYIELKDISKNYIIHRASAGLVTHHEMLRCTTWYIIFYILSYDAPDNKLILHDIMLIQIMVTICCTEASTFSYLISQICMCYICWTQPTSIYVPYIKTTPTMFERQTNIDVES